MKTPLSLALIFVLLIAAPLPATAQEVRLPFTPDPEGCTVTPLTTEQMSDLYAIEEPFQVKRNVSDRAVADEDTAEAIDVIITSIACSNANQPLAALALTTDYFLATLFWSEPGQDELGHLIAASSREPDPAAQEDRLTIESIGVPVVYDDNAIGFDVDTGNAIARYSDHIILIEESGEWLIDEVIAVDEIRLATPEAIASLLPKP